MSNQNLKTLDGLGCPCIVGLSPDCPFPNFPASNGVAEGLYWFNVAGTPRELFSDGLGFVLVGSSLLNAAAGYGTETIDTPIIKGANVIYDQAGMQALVLSGGAADVKITSDNYPLAPPGNVEQVISTTGFPITRLGLYLSLSGTPASVLGSDNWSGQTTRLDRTCRAGVDGPLVPLSTVIYWACGNTLGMVWEAGGGSHWDFGIAPAGGLNLWIR